MLASRLDQGFSPASVFVGGAKGIWLDPFDMSTGFQDTAGTTPVAAATDPVGRRNDKSGNALNVLQATGGARPEFTVNGSVNSDYCDGLDDGYSTDVFAAGTLIVGMDMFVALNRSSTANMVTASETPADVGQFIGAMQAGNVSLCCTGVGVAWTSYVNGVQVGGTNTTTRDQLNTAMGSGAWRVMEFRDLSMSGWTQFTFSLFTSFMFNGDMAGLILCPAQTDAKRTSLRRWLGAKVGLSL